MKCEEKLNDTKKKNSKEVTMKPKHLLVLSIILSVAMVLMTACATPTKTADTAVMGPQWVMKGSGAFDV